MRKMGDKLEVNEAPTAEEEDAELAGDEGAAMNDDYDTLSGPSEEKYYLLSAAFTATSGDNLPAGSAVKGTQKGSVIDTKHGEVPINMVGALAIGPNMPFGLRDGRSGILSHSVATRQGEQFVLNLHQGGQVQVKYSDLAPVGNSSLIRQQGTSTQMPETGMSTGMKIGILLFVVFLVCGLLAGLYLYLDQDDEDEFDELERMEAGYGRGYERRATKGGRRKKGNRKYLSGKELESAAKKRGGRKKRSASRKPRKSRRDRDRRKSRKPRKSRRDRKPRGGRQRSRIDQTVNRRL